MDHYGRKEVATLLGIRDDTFKKNIRSGMYDHVIGSPRRIGANGRRVYSREQVEKLIEWYHGTDVRLRCIAMGGGVQSTTMLLMHLHGEWDPPPDCAMFIDLGWESQATYDNLRQLQGISQRSGFPFQWVAERNIREDLLAASRDRRNTVRSPPFFLRNAEGRKAQLNRNCTASYKVDVMRTKLREILRIPSGRWTRYRVEVWLGITTDEAHRLNNHSQTPWLVNRFPLCDRGMSRDDCVVWLRAHGYAVPPKSACLGCPYRPDVDWAEMKAKRPEDWDSVVEVDRAIRAGVNKVRSPLYLHSSLQPLEEVRFDETRRGLWGEECSGHCAT